VEHRHDENVQVGYCRCAQVNAIIPATAMVDEKTSGLNLVSLVGDACELAHHESSCQAGPIFFGRRAHGFWC